MVVQEPKSLQHLLRDSYLPSGNNNVCEVNVAQEAKQPILKQREDDPFFFQFLQSSCPDVLLSNSKPVC
jgi:hypothetical protein